MDGSTGTRSRWPPGGGAVVRMTITAPPAARTAWASNSSCGATVAALGLFVSTLTEVPVAAMSATAILVVVVEILTAVPQLSVIHPWLFFTEWLNFGDLLRSPIAWDGIVSGLSLQAGWIAVLLALAWARMTSKDVTS